MNELYPIFLKLDQLEILVVGGGYVAAEKLGFIYKSSPRARITIVADFIRPEVAEIIAGKSVKVIQRKYRRRDLRGKHIVIAATNKLPVNYKVRAHCATRNIIVNVADDPENCDFYMGGIVTKGNLKLGISTNGKSPTLAKRLRQLFEQIFPAEIDELLENLNTYRATLQQDFEEKVETLNNLTESLIQQESNN
ncbi:MAG: bifunctional precorrin-2 dehydrogenase/sirohydrochlorin ferrochelatase [Saprospiraceae bacterium]